jgi:hypothetical protein
VSDIATRLRQTRANMIGTDDEQHYWDCYDAAAAIERLRLTDEEREAVAWFSDYSDTPGEERHAVVLAKLLERTRPPGATG